MFGKCDQKIQVPLKSDKNTRCVISGFRCELAENWEIWILEPGGWDRYVVSKLRNKITATRCVKTQKIAVLKNTR